MSLYVPAHFAGRESRDDRAARARLPVRDARHARRAASRIVTHLPLLWVADCEPHGTLFGHFARANPHAEARPAPNRSRSFTVRTRT